MCRTPTSTWRAPATCPAAWQGVPALCCAAGACTRGSVLRDMRVTPPLATQVLLQCDVNDGPP
jgi:hypothetical protein